MSNLLKKLKELLVKSNSSGIPLPTLRDPKDGKGSVTLTMFFIAFNIAAFTLIGKVTSFFQGVDYQNVMYLFVATGGFYLGRGLRKTANGLDIEKKE